MLDGCPWTCYTGLPLSHRPPPGPGSPEKRPILIFPIKKDTMFKNLETRQKALKDRMIGKKWDPWMVTEETLEPPPSIQSIALDPSRPVHTSEGFYVKSKKRECPGSRSEHNVLMSEFVISSGKMECPNCKRAIGVQLKGRWTQKSIQENLDQHVFVSMRLHRLQ